MRFGMELTFNWLEGIRKYKVRAKLPDRRIFLGYFTEEELRDQDFRYLIDQSRAGSQGQVSVNAALTASRRE